MPSNSLLHFITNIVKFKGNSKYPLLKKKEKLNDDEKEKLKELEKVVPELISVYQAKEKLRDIFDSKITSDQAFWKLVEWT